MDTDQIKFKQFLTDLSKDYVGLKYRWLRMLLHGVIPIQCLEVSTTGLELFNELAELGQISNTDVTLLSELAKTTSQKSAKQRIAKYKKKIQCSETLGTSLTPYRKALFEALRNAGPNDLLKVIGFYSLKDYNFDNIWDVVFHLEQQELLDDTQEKFKLFADLLNKKTRSVFLAALKTLKRDATTTSPQLLDTQSEPNLQRFLKLDKRPNVARYLAGIHTTVRIYWPWIALSILIMFVAIQLPKFNLPLTPKAPSRDWQAEGLRRMRENDLKNNKRGTVKVYDREFKFEGGHEFWKYYSTATDVVTGTKAEAKGYQSMGGANEHSIENLIYKLMAKKSIKN
ncbi:uncharacterized protein [Antedon mediterranea]|uniref:uncharacterized protein n=1 Tax=Antedon mediterranea TaxID=105859 RepID=UPI003AF6040B